MGLGYQSSYLKIQYIVTPTPTKSKASIIFIDQITSFNFFYTNIECAHAIGIRNVAVPHIKPKITQVDVIGKSFI